MSGSSATTRTRDVRGVRCNEFGAPVEALGVTRDDLLRPGTVVQLGLPPAPHRLADPHHRSRIRHCVARSCRTGARRTVDRLSGPNRPPREQARDGARAGSGGCIAAWRPIPAKTERGRDRPTPGTASAPGSVEDECARRRHRGPEASRGVRYPDAHGRPLPAGFSRWSPDHREKADAYAARIPSHPPLAGCLQRVGALALGRVRAWAATGRARRGGGGVLRGARGVVGRRFARRRALPAARTRPDDPGGRARRRALLPAPA